MDKAKEVDRLKREAQEVRLSNAALCRRAGVNPSTWWRAREFPESIALETIEKLETAIKSKRAERAAA